jgi:heme-degrading monooxygenase HmoA
MHARVSFYQLSEGGDADQAISAFGDSAGAVEELEGEEGIMLLVDRSSGKAMSITFWDTEDHLNGSAERANQVRQTASSAAGVSIMGVENYEVALDRRK